MAEGWEPPVPAFSADIDPNSRAIALYVGIQRPTSHSLEAFNAIISANAPPNYDLASFTDRAGHKNYVYIAYFSNSTEHVQWEDSSGFTASGLVTAEKEREMFTFSFLSSYCQLLSPRFSARTG